MTNFYTSDLHWGHRFVSDLRGFGVPDEHDWRLITNWRATVKEDDQVFVLGDLAVSSPTKALEIMKSLPGRKHLISGNHDECHPLHSKALKAFPKYAAVFETVSSAGRRKVNGINFLMSHFPYKSDHTDEVRYTQWRLPDEGQFLIHGHTHSSEKYTSDHEFHVGVDAWDMQLVPEQTVIDWVMERMSDE